MLWILYLVNYYLCFFRCSSWGGGEGSSCSFIRNIFLCLFSLFNFFLSLWNVKQLPILILKWSLCVWASLCSQHIPCGFVEGTRSEMNMVTSSPRVAVESPVTLMGDVARDSGARPRCETGLLLSSVVITILSEVWVGPKVLGQKPWGLSQSWFYFLQVCALPLLPEQVLGNPGTRNSRQSSELKTASHFQFQECQAVAALTSFRCSTRSKQAPSSLAAVLPSATP